MFTRLSKLVTAAGMAAALGLGTVPKPAIASTQSTINTALGAAAVIGGLILYNNYEHKRQAANTIVGYTGNGGTIYGDGRIVMPNGQTIYPNSNGQYPWGQTAYYGSNPGGYTYDTQRTGRWDRTGRHAYAYRHGADGNGNANAYAHNGNGYGGANGNAHGHANGNNGRWGNGNVNSERHDRVRDRDRDHH